MGFASTRSRIELQKVALKMFIDFHDGSLISTSIAIIGGAEHGDYILFMTPIVPLHHELMSSGDHCEVVGLVKLVRNVFPESVTGSARTDIPPFSVIGVRP